MSIPLPTRKLRNELSYAKFKRFLSRDNRETCAQGKENVLNEERSKKSCVQGFKSDHELRPTCDFFPIELLKWQFSNSLKVN